MRGSVRRLTRALIVAAIAATGIVVSSAPALAAPRVTTLEPHKGTVGAPIHVAGTGCPPPAGGGPAGNFSVANGSGVEFEFKATAEGTFSFDYTVPPAEAGEQHPDSIYETFLECYSQKRTVNGPSYEITGPAFLLSPKAAPLGSKVRVKGTGCVQDGDGSDDAQLIVDGQTVMSFKVGADFTFDFQFDVPATLTPDRRYIVQVDCLIQRLESAAGEGGQRAVVPTLLLVTPAVAAGSTTTTQPPANEQKGSQVLLFALAMLIAAALVAYVIRRRRRVAEPRPEPTAPAPELVPEPVVARAIPEPVAEEEEQELERIAAAEEAERDRIAAAEEAERERIAAEEAAELARLAAEEEAARIAAEEAELERIAAEEEAARQRIAAEEEAARQRIAAEEEAARQRIAAEEEAARLAAEEAERALLEAEAEAERQRIAAEEAELARIAAEEEAELVRIAAEEEAERARIAAEEEAERQRIALVNERARRAIEEAQRRRAEAEEAERARLEAEELARLAAEPEEAEEPEPAMAEPPARVPVDNDDVSEPLPPFAAQQPVELTAFGDVRVDPYYWLRERENPETIAYLEAENAWADAYLEPLADLRQTLFDTIKERTKEDDTSPPVPLRGWEYYVRTAEGAQYPDSCRRPRGGGEETVILNRNEMAEGHDYLSCVGPSISPSDRYCAYATDYDGSEKYTIRVRDLTTLEDLPDEIPDTSGDMCWVTDDVLLYVMLDEAHRPYQVRRHVMGDDPLDDHTIYEDLDERFFVHVRRDTAERFVFIHCGSKISNEDRFLRIDDPLGPLTLVEPRADGLEYHTEDDGERLIILTNADGAVDFKVVTAPPVAPGRANWTELLPHRPGTRLTEVAPFKTFIAFGERHDALTSIRILDRATGLQHAMHHNEAVYAAEIDANAEFDTTVLRFTFTSLNTPTTWIDYDVTTKQPTVIKQNEVLGGFSPGNYVTAREWAVAPDGVRIPISILHRKDFVKDGTGPALLYGYGSYEISIDPTFSIPRLNLVDRGVVYAIAHIRGGGEMGREWYENGKMLKKRNTFSDFIACARHLIDNGWCAPDRLAARGGSAGGLLMGAVANMAPNVFNTIVAEVPFVDVVTTMSDETIPLTVTEWEEWGNPRDNADDYQYMKSYSPYDNVDEMDYPALYVEAGLNDPRVQYWEPAKWVAKLRVTKTDDRPLLLRTDMGAGHGGPSGRYSAWEDEARVQAFVLEQLGIDE